MATSQIIADYDTNLLEYQKFKQRNLYLLKRCKKIAKNIEQQERTIKNLDKKISNAKICLRDVETAIELISSYASSYDGSYNGSYIGSYTDFEYEMPYRKKKGHYYISTREIVEIFIIIFGLMFVGLVEYFT